MSFNASIYCIHVYVSINIWYSLCKSLSGIPNYNPIFGIQLLAYLDFAPQLQKLLAGSLDALVDRVGNDPRILFAPAFLDKDRWHLDLMETDDFIGAGTEYHETCRCGALIYGANKRPQQWSLCVSCITRRIAIIIHIERACYLLLYCYVTSTNTNWKDVKTVRVPLRSALLCH